jgi:hypothetical protein
LFGAKIVQFHLTQFHTSGKTLFVDQLTYSGLIGRLLIDLDNTYRCCHPIEYTAKGIFSLNCIDLCTRRSTKPDAVAGCSLTIVLDRLILLIRISSKTAFRHVGTVSVWLFQRVG